MLPFQLSFNHSHKQTNKQKKDSTKAYNLSVCELMLTEKMPMLLAEYEKLPAAGKSDQLLAGWVFESPVKSCSDPKLPTDGNNAPLPLKRCCWQIILTIRAHSRAWEEIFFNERVFVLLIYWARWACI